jgi:hypothetical protein
MNTVLRLLLATAVVLLWASTLLDPYTWFRNASDFVLPAPVWQTFLGLVNAAFFPAVLILLWRQRCSGAMMVLLFEIAFNVTVNLIHLHRDGLQRFTHGFAGEQYLSAYLVLLLIRAWLIAGVARMKDSS